MREHPCGTCDWWNTENSEAHFDHSYGNCWANGVGGGKDRRHGSDACWRHSALHKQPAATPLAQGEGEDELIALSCAVCGQPHTAKRLVEERDALQAKCDEVLASVERKEEWRKYWKEECESILNSLQDERDKWAVKHDEAQHNAGALAVALDASKAAEKLALARAKRLEEALLAAERVNDAGEGDEGHNLAWIIAHNANMAALRGERDEWKARAEKGEGENVNLRNGWKAASSAAHIEISRQDTRIATLAAELAAAQAPATDEPAYEKCLRGGKYEGQRCLCPTCSNTDACSSFAGCDVEDRYGDEGHCDITTVCSGYHPERDEPAKEDG